MPEVKADVLEFALPGPEYEAIHWVHNEHFTASVAPLEQSLQALNLRTAADGLPQSVYINGYSYGRDTQIKPGEQVPDEAVVAGWKARRLPAVDAVCAELEAFDPASVAPGQWRETLAAQQKRFWEAFGGVHADTMGQVFPASALWVQEYTARFGQDSALDAVAMLAGFPNASADRADALWDLSRVAATDPAVLAAVRSGRLPAGASSGAVDFRRQFDALLERFGFTTVTHLLDLPTWREDYGIPLAMIAAMAQEPPERSPQHAEAEAARRREALEAALAAQNASEEAIQRLQRILVVARYLPSASEDHNLLCDQRMIAAARARWLAVGGHLVAQQRLASADDVFYLAFEELIGALEDGDTVLPSEVADRRERQARWRVTPPPAQLGAVEPPGEARVLRGIAASRGVYRGRARVIASLREAAALEPGEVLVCPATSPEWTPYFGVAGALVTATGSLLAHAAVVAREFAIPAVVGARGAASIIATGDLVEVDGTQGRVTVLEGR